jgi:signal transduction histidine kinase
LLPIWAVADKIKQALLNIILNSLKVMGENGKTGITRITAEVHNDLKGLPENRCVQIVIKDNGPGISPEDIDFIFDPFYTCHSDGTGLGLSITHTIIEEHGGQIFAHSEFGQGASFTINLPIMDRDYGKNTDH